MFDLGWSELLLIGVVALIVVGPKDLPGMFHTLGRFTAKAKNMAREFQRAMDDAANESGMKDAASDLRGLTNPRKMGLDKLKDAAGDFENWDPKFSGSSKKRSEGETPPRDASGTAATGAGNSKATAAKAEGTKKPATKKPAAKSSAARKPAATGTAAKPASGKTGTTKPAAAKKSPPRKTAASKTTARKRTTGAKSDDA